MKKLLPPITTGLLLILLLVITMLSDRLIGHDRLQQVSTLPDYTLSASKDNVVTSTELKDAPDFTVTDAQGNTISLKQFRGKTVVINFWASWAPPSYQELAMYQQAYNELKDEVHFMMINTTSDQRETREKADKMIADNGFTFPVYYDLDASAAKAYQVISLPTSYFIDANGKAVAYANAPINRYGFDLGLQACRKNAEQSSTPEETTEATEPEEVTQSTIPEETP